MGGECGAGASTASMTTGAVLGRRERALSPFAIGKSDKVIDGVEHGRSNARTSGMDYNQTPRTARRYGAYLFCGLYGLRHCTAGSGGGCILPPLAYGVGRSLPEVVLARARPQPYQREGDTVWQSGWTFAKSKHR